MPPLRNAVLMLVAMVLAAAPLAGGYGAAAGADCLVQQVDLPDGSCCGDSAPGPACAVPCATGCGPVVSAAEPSASDKSRIVASAARPLQSSTSHTRAPDTAPPKSSLA
jgi:hypothetical protein